MNITNSSDVVADEYQFFLDNNPDVRFVDGITVDLCGLMRGKRYPREDLHKLYTTGLALPYTVYLMDVTGDNSDPCGRGFADGDPDGICLPVSGSLVRVPWADEPRGQVLLSMFSSTGSPSLVDPRNVAKHVLERFKPLGITPVVAFELEFYLVDNEKILDGAPQAPVSPATGRRERSTQVYGIDELDGFAAFFAEVHSAAALQQIPAAVASSEFAPGQYEINLDHSGSGMHLHISLLNELGENIFNEGAELDSRELRSAVGGLLATMYDATAIFAPHLNAFRRYEPNTYVPVCKSWGYNNRSVACRIPVSDGQNRRIEHRMASADTNPYLVLAAVLAGIHKGLIEKTDPGKPTVANACAEIDLEMPLDWNNAIERTRSSQTLKQYLTEEVVELYCETKRGEMQSFCQTISPKEYSWYL